MPSRKFKARKRALKNDEDLRIQRFAGLDLGIVLALASILIFIVGSYAVLFSAFMPLTGFPILDLLARDTHYKYFAFLIIPMSTYFVIANWVGWQYYQNS